MTNCANKMQRWARLKNIAPGGDVKSVKKEREIPNDLVGFAQLLSVAKTQEDFEALNTVFNRAIDMPKCLELKELTKAELCNKLNTCRMAMENNDDFYLIKTKIVKSYNEIVIKNTGKLIAEFKMTPITGLISNITLKVPKGTIINKLPEYDVIFKLDAKPHIIIEKDNFEYHLFYDQSWIFSHGEVYGHPLFTFTMNIDENTRIKDIIPEISYYAIEMHNTDLVNLFHGFTYRVQMKTIFMDKMTNIQVSVKSGDSYYLVHTYQFNFDDKPLKVNLNEEEPSDIKH